MSIRLALELITLALTFHAFDLITGVIKGYKEEKGLQSSKLRDGLFKKMGFILSYILCIGIKFSSQFIDLGILQDLLMPVVTFAIFTEIISIIENISVLNPAIAEKLKSFIGNNGGYLNLSATRLYGIDISKWQSPDIITNSQDFVIIKSSEGKGYTDEKFKAHANRAVQLNKLLGFYHYARPDLNPNPADEVDSFLSIVSPFIGKAILALDWEGLALSYPVEWAYSFLLLVEQRTGYKPFIYMSASPAGEDRFRIIADAGFPLWVADYEGEINPTVWNADKIIIRQYSNSAGQLDLDEFYGSQSLFAQYSTAPNTEQDSTAQDSTAQGGADMGCNDMNYTEFAVESGEGFWSFAERVTGTGVNGEVIAIFNGLDYYNHVLYTGDILKVANIWLSVDIAETDDYELAVGDIVRVKSLVDYDGNNIADWVLNTQFRVLEIEGDRVVIGDMAGNVTGAWHKIDLAVF